MGSLKYMNLIDQKNVIAVCSRTFSKNLILRNELEKQYKNVKFNDEGLKLEGEQLISFLSGCSKSIVALEIINESIIKELPNLKTISKFGVGIDNLDIKAIKSHGIKISYSPGTNKRSVSEMVISTAILLLREAYKANIYLKKRNWKQHIGNLLSNKIVGIIGCGNIGKDLVTILKPFGCKILVFDIVDYKDFYIENSIIKTSLENLLSTSDIVTIHTPLNNSTQNILSKTKLNLMKKNSILINFARGGLVDEIELKNLLLKGKIKAAAFDVFKNEPLLDEELYKLDNFFATPHIGGSAIESIIEMGMAAINGLKK